MAGKGDSYRPVKSQKWKDNWERIFKKKEKKNEPKDTTSVYC
jgi:hypothetical protein